MVAAVLFGVVIVLQLLLAAGVLPVTMAWGGTQETLTSGLRMASLVSAVVLALFALVILRRAGVLGTPPIPTAVKVLSWIVTAFVALNTLGNLASQSLTETLVFTPITALLTVTCGVVSASKATNRGGPETPSSEVA